tara:strand:+ start:388 stop:540 length:153 start_codon:yes stop_codon:yes gene_type:complete
MLLLQGVSWLRHRQADEIPLRLLRYFCVPKLKKQNVKQACPEAIDHEIVP